MADKLYALRITRRTKQSVREIAYYIRDELKAPEASVAWVLRIRSGIKSLQTFPTKIQLTPEDPWRDLGVRRKPVGNFYIYFLVFEELSLIRVIDVIYQRREQIMSLRDTPLEV